MAVFEEEKDTKGGGHEDTRRHTKRHEDTLSWLF